MDTLIINLLAEKYADEFSSNGDDLISEVERHTLKMHPQAHMLSGHVQGKFLELLSCLLRPQRILEIGTFTGFSALCLAKGLQENGQLHTIDVREEDAITAKNYFERSE